MAQEPRLSKADWAAIRKVIGRQLAALRAGDGKRAFAYASPGIQARFGDAQGFLAMVREAYPELLAARYSEFLDGAVIDGIIVQPLRLIAPDNTVRVALYTLEKGPAAGASTAARSRRRRCRPPSRTGTCAALPSAPAAGA